MGQRQGEIAGNRAKCGKYGVSFLNTGVCFPILISKKIFWKILADMVVKIGGLFSDFDFGKIFRKIGGHTITTQYS